MNDGLIGTTATTPVLCMMAVAKERRDTKGYDACKRGKQDTRFLRLLLFGVIPARYLQIVILSVKLVYSPSSIPPSE